MRSDDEEASVVSGWELQGHQGAPMNVRQLCETIAKNRQSATDAMIRPAGVQDWIPLAEITAVAEMLEKTIEKLNNAESTQVCVS